MSFPSVLPHCVRRVRGIRRAPVLAAAVLMGGSLLVGCGNEADERAEDPAGESSSAETPSESSSQSPTESESPAEVETDPATGLPVCSQLWVDGATLPADYKSCSEDGSEVKPVKRTCGFGGTLIEHDNRFYAMKGRKITEVEDLASDPDYKTILASCQA